jgi:hypothetical protein
VCCGYAKRAGKKLITNNILMAEAGEHENLFYGENSFEIKKGRAREKNAFIMRRKNVLSSFMLISPRAAVMYMKLYCRNVPC